MLPNINTSRIKAEYLKNTAVKEKLRTGHIVKIVKPLTYTEKGFLYVVFLKSDYISG